MRMPTHILVDRDGVLRREKEVIPGVKELFAGFSSKNILATVLSNNSRERGDDLLRDFSSDMYGVSVDHMPRAITSADATAMWFQRNIVEISSQRVYVIGDQGIRSALQEIGIPFANDSWDGQGWAEEPPTHVVCGFSKDVNYQKLAPAWNAIHQHGVHFIATNKDPAYSNEKGELLPANGAAVACLETALHASTKATVIGKPGTFMAEMALQEMGAKKGKAVIGVLGDTVEQDVLLAENLRRAGWDVDMYAVLSGVLTEEEALRHPSIDEIFRDITDFRERILVSTVDSRPSPRPLSVRLRQGLSRIRRLLRFQR